MLFALVIDITDEEEHKGISEPIKVLSIIDLDPVANIHYFKSKHYKLKPSATQGRINQFYRVVCEVANKYSQVYVTLSRFNTCLTRATTNDSLIDITISLESLIREKHELSFKFSTYLSFIIGETPQERFDALKELTNLYNARSGIVHGTPEDKESIKAIKQVANNWDCIVVLTKKAITYYVFYLYSEIHNTQQAPWKDHLKRLMLGIDSRLFD
jgi:hypothetical protein